MPIEMPRGLPFAVDTWTAASGRKRHRFLTHAHKDHLTGIATHAAWPIYATRLTKTLARQYFPLLDDSLFVEIEVGEAILIDDPDGAFSVTAFDANHCPGAVMFLFEGKFGSVLHTGDCRLTPDCLLYLPLKYISKKGKESACHIDYLFLDCTFGSCSLKIPSKHSAIQQVINCIWKHPNVPVVYLACDLLGQEGILVEVSKTFGSKIFVDKTNNSECFQSLSHLAPEIISQDASCRFQVIEGFPRLYERTSEKIAEARANLQTEPLFIRPSAQWYACNDHTELTQKQKPRLTEAEKDEFGVWHVCYSMHSSREELEWALQLLQPKWVISTTPPCRAMELDYVKKHCFKTHITHDDPLWKLLKVNPGKSSPLPASTASKVAKDCGSTSLVEVTRTLDCNQDLKNLSMDSMTLELPPPERARPITLFGRARLGHADILLEEKRSGSTTGESKELMSSGEEKVKECGSALQGEDIIAAHQAPSLENNMLEEQTSSPLSGDTSISEAIAEKSEEEADVKRNISCIGSSKNFSESLRKLYRSRNVPVPRPIPSLVELMDVSKRIKITSGSSFNRLTYCYNSSVSIYHGKEVIYTQANKGNLLNHHQ